MNPNYILRTKTQISKLREILVKCASSENPGETFYKSGARNVLFRLEANFRMYRKIAESKKLDKWYKQMKELEDFLGSLDYHEAIYNEFKTNEKVQKSAHNIFYVRYEEESRFLGELLLERGWCNAAKLDELESDLNELKPMSSEEENEAVAAFMIAEMEKVSTQYEEGEIDLSLLEEGLHEFRRKIRWISIYAAIMDGGFQLKNVTPSAEMLNRYCTDEIVNSPFNKFPDPMPGQETIVVQSVWFYGLSWLIQQLGELKDAGQLFEAAHELVNQAQLTPGERDAFLAHYVSKLPFNPQNVLHEAECHIDNFLYRDRIFKRIIRDLRRGQNRN